MGEVNDTAYFGRKLFTNGNIFFNAAYPEIELKKVKSERPFAPCATSTPSRSNINNKDNEINLEQFVASGNLKPAVTIHRKVPPKIPEGQASAGPPLTISSIFSLQNDEQGNENKAQAHDSLVQQLSINSVFSLQNGQRADSETATNVKRLQQTPITANQMGHTKPHFEELDIASSSDDEHIQVVYSSIKQNKKEQTKVNLAVSDEVLVFPKGKSAANKESGKQGIDRASNVKKGTEQTKKLMTVEAQIHTQKKTNATKKTAKSQISGTVRRNNHLVSPEGTQKLQDMKEMNSDKKVTSWLGSCSQIKETALSDEELFRVPAKQKSSVKRGRKIEALSSSHENESQSKLETTSKLNTQAVKRPGRKRKSVENSDPHLAQKEKPFKTKCIKSPQKFKKTKLGEKVLQPNEVSNISEEIANVSVGRKRTRAGKKAQLVNQEQNLKTKTKNQKVMPVARRSRRNVKEWTKKDITNIEKIIKEVSKGGTSSDIIQSNLNENTNGLDDFPPVLEPQVSKDPEIDSVADKQGKAVHIKGGTTKAKKGSKTNGKKPIETTSDENTKGIMEEGIAVNKDSLRLFKVDETEKWESLNETDNGVLLSNNMQFGNVCQGFIKIMPKSEFSECLPSHQIFTVVKGRGVLSDKTEKHTVTTGQQINIYADQFFKFQNLGNQELHLSYVKIKKMET